MKYSKKFDESYQFYSSIIGVFDFCGTLNPTFEAIEDKTGLSAKEVFYHIDSHGKNMPCYEPDLLNQLLLTKASLNFQIKQWAEGRAEGTLPLQEFSKEMVKSQYGEEAVNENVYTTEWIDGNCIKYRDIQEQYNLPNWVCLAVEQQKLKYYKS